MPSYLSILIDIKKGCKMTKKKNKKPPIPDEAFKNLDEAIAALERAVDKLKETRNNICR